MTVAVGIRVPGEGAVLVSDGRVVDASNRIYTDSSVKYGVFGHCIVLVAGNDARALPTLADRGAKTFADIVEYVVSCREYWDEDDPWYLLVWDSRRQRLSGLDGDGTEVEYSASACIGCGGDVAAGALAAMPRPKSLDEATKQAQRAVKLACLHNAACGGRIRTVVARGRRKPLIFL